MLSEKDRKLSDSAREKEITLMEHQSSSMTEWTSLGKGERRCVE
jgi:hypothetical protein